MQYAESIMRNQKMRYFYQMRIENRIRIMKRKKLKICAARTKDVQALGLLVSVN